MSEQKEASGDGERIGKYLTARKRPRTKDRKTDKWHILANDGCGILGRIEWYSGWRCYVFAPYPSTSFNAECLDDIKKFLMKEMEARKK